VNYDKLDRDDICNQIHEFCLGRPMDRRRWLMLNELRVTAIAEKAAATFAPWVRTAISQVAYPVTPASKEWDALMAEICGERLDARQWLADLWDLTMTWDHLVDGDPMDVWRAERAFEAIVLQWPFNVFWQKHGPLLSPVLSNALAAWRTDERERHYDIYSETARAVAFCLGGQARVKQFSPRVQSAVKGLLMEDNERDGQ